MAHLEYYNNLKSTVDIFHDSHVELIRNVCAELNASNRVDELIAKYVDSSVKLKAKRDPNQPRAWRNSFVMFCTEQRENLDSKDENVNLGDMMKEWGAKWRAMDEDSRNKYKELSIADKTRYTTEMEDYKNALFSNQ